MLTKERRGEIAYTLLKHRISKDGIPLNKDEFKRSLGNLAKATGIDEKELAEFAEMTVRDLVDATFKK